jgi:hypothetical protein
MSNYFNSNIMCYTVSKEENIIVCYGNEQFINCLFQLITQNKTYYDLILSFPGFCLFFLCIFVVIYILSRRILFFDLLLHGIIRLEREQYLLPYTCQIGYIYL